MPGMTWSRDVFAGGWRQNGGAGRLNTEAGPSTVVRSAQSGRPSDRLPLIYSPLSGFAQRRLGNREKSPSVEQRTSPYSMASAAR